MDLLFLAHRIPYPPVKGDKIRSWHLLRHLAARHRVHLGAFIDDPADWEHAPMLRALCASVCLRPLQRRHLAARAVPALLSSQALSLAAYDDPPMRRWVAERLAQSPQLVFAYSAASALLLPQDLRPPLVLDLVDCDSEKWRARAAAGGPLRLLFRREAAAVLAFERAAATRAARTLLVSEAEAFLAKRLLPASAMIQAIPNGVDTAYFDPGLVHPSPYPPSPPVIVFTGAMDYAPNVEAVLWLTREILPRLTAQALPFRLAIVGANPGRPVWQLAGPGIQVTGRVADVRPYLAHAALAVAPLRLARGLQNKVLEAMAMARAVVATEEAATGIAARVGEHLLVAGNADEFAQQIARLLRDPDQASAMGARARHQVTEHHAWPAQLARMDAVLEELVGKAG